MTGRTTGALLAGAVVAFAATGCVVTDESGGRGNRLPPGASATDSVLTAVDAFEALPRVEAGRGEPRFLTLDSAPLRNGDMFDVTITTVVEIALRDATNDSAATPEFSLTDLRAQSTSSFTGRTVGRLRGRLAVTRVDEVGRIRAAIFETTEAALVRDGELLARVPAGRTVRLIRSVADGDEGTRASLRVQFGPDDLGPTTEQLFRMCLVDPLERRDWSTVAGFDRARRPGETWPLTTGAITTLLGLPDNGAIDPAGVARTISASSAREPIVELRINAASVIDDRIIDAFGPSLAGLPDAASVHRITGTTTGDAVEGAQRTSVIAHRFRLLDRRGAVSGERVERLEVSIIPVTPSFGS